MNHYAIILLSTLVLLSACAPLDDQVGCTKEAKVCPDGSTVGRNYPDCEFAPCPGEAECGTMDVSCDEGGFAVCTDGTWTCSNEETKDITVCTERTDVCYEIYQPVCGYDSKDNVIQTYPNDCFACQDETIAYYKEGSCEENDGDYTCPPLETIDCMPIVEADKQALCSGPYREWLVQNCDITFTY